MNKFIRTDKGIYELKENMTIEKGIYSFFRKIYNTPEKHLFRNDKDLGEVVNQADTIDELCDLYIDEETQTIFHKHNGYLINWRTNLVYSLEGLTKEFHSVKGAIYTDNGLIYVAKLNDKGELELI